MTAQLKEWKKEWQKRDDKKNRNLKCPTNPEGVEHQ
jgi:hypothetical protein